MKTTKKVTHGCVVQTFDDKGDCIGQEFTAGDPVEWEDDQGSPIDCPDDSWYHPFDMLPANIDSILDRIEKQLILMIQPIAERAGITLINCCDDNSTLMERLGELTRRLNAMDAKEPRDV